MTPEQKNRLRKLEKAYGTKADRVCELILVQFRPNSPSVVSFIVDAAGCICSAEQMSDRMLSLTETKER